MHLAVRLFCSLALLLIIGCESSHPSPKQAETPAPAVQSLNIATMSIDTLTTLGGWMSSHPGDVVSEDVPTGVMPDHLCRIATTRLDITGRSIIRSAVFNVANPPPGEVLPTDTNHVAEQDCHLRAIWLETVEADPLRAQVVADSFARLLDVTLGASRFGIAMSGVGTGQWTDGRTWTGRGTTVVLGIVPPYLHGPSGDATPQPTPQRVVVAAFAPHSGLDPLRARMERINQDDEWEDERELVLARTDSAIQWAELPRIAVDLRRVLAGVRSARFSDSLATPAFDSALVRAVSTIRDTAPFLRPSRRAAAFLAGDLVLQSAVRSLDAVDTTSGDFHLRRALEQSGVPFEHEPLGAVHVYTRPWLWEAYRLDSLGRAGHMAFMTLLAAGWSTKPQCADGADAYNRVIQRGEAELRRSTADPLIHYYVGLAYHDIVSLARGGALDDYVDREDVVPLAPAARAKAIEHFRAALAAPGDRRMRRHAWRTAMALLLNRSLGTRYFCVYD